MMTRRWAPEPERLVPRGRPSVSLGAGDPASDHSISALGRFVDRRFGAGREDSRWVSFCPEVVV